MCHMQALRIWLPGDFNKDFIAALMVYIHLALTFISIPPCSELLILTRVDGGVMVVGGGVG